LKFLISDIYFDVFTGEVGMLIAPSKASAFVASGLFPGRYPKLAS